MVKIFACKFEENEADILVDKMSLLALKERSRVERYRQTKDMCLSFIGLAMIHAFCECFTDYSETVNIVGIDDLFGNPEIFNRNPISFNEEGKPYFDDKNKTFFNISHSEDWCFVAFSNSEVGIDVQKIKKLNGNVAQRFFNEKDNEYINEDEALSLERTIEVWCIKESYVKMLGIGLGYGLDSFYADFSDNTIIDEKNKGKTAKFVTEEFLNDYIWSFCIPCEEEN